jgi:hypothetical protein
VSQTGIDSLRILFCLPLIFIHAHQLLATARVLAKAIVGDSIKPCGKSRFTAKAADVLVNANKGFLRQIISQRNVRARELSEEATHARLMASYQFTERVLVVIGKNSRDKVRISELDGIDTTVLAEEEERSFSPPISIP